MSPPAPDLGDSTSQYLWEFEETKRYPEKDKAHLTEFEKRYPPDRPGQELGRNARVFRVYQDRMKALDGEMTTAWNDAINLILIFAGLFSAVLTAFLIDLSRKLEPDHAEFASLALFAIASISAGTNVTLPELHDPREFKPRSDDYTVNALWFVSLSLALVVSMFAMLVKEWIHVFGSRMRQPIKNLRQWAYRHRAFSDGIERWRLDAFVSSLSFGLHLALWLFLVGLSIRTSTLGFAIFIPATVLASLALLVHVLTIVAPLVDLACPTVQPYLIHGWSFIYRFIVAHYPTLRRLKHQLTRLAKRIEHLVRGTVPFDENPDTPKYRLTGSIQEVGILSWMLMHLVEEDDVRIALDAAVHLGMTDREYVIKGLKIPLESLVIRRAEILHLHMSSYIDHDPAEVARVLRATLCFGAPNRIPQQTLVDLSRVRTHEVGVLASMCLMYYRSRTRDSAEMICRALGGHNRPPDARLATPVSDHTRLLLRHVLAEAAKINCPLVSIEGCAKLAGTFCHNYPDVPSWVDLVARLIQQTDPSSMPGGWSSHTTQTFIQILDRALPENEAWSTLASCLFKHGSSDMMQSYWNSNIAKTLYHHFDNHHRRATASPTDLQSHRVLASSLLSLFSRISDLTVRGPLFHGKMRDTMEQSMLNLLQPRSTRHGQTTSIWRLALHLASPGWGIDDITTAHRPSGSARDSGGICHTADQLDATSQHVATSMAKICRLLCALLNLKECADLANDMFEQLLSDESCILRFVDVRIDDSRALDIVRHVLAAASLQGEGTEAERHSATDRARVFLTMLPEGLIRRAEKEVERTKHEALATAHEIETVDRAACVNEADMTPPQDEDKS